MKTLILTADDFGLSTSVNAAVEAAHREGVLGSASLMVGAPGAADAVARARRLPGLKVGLHLVLTSGRPMSPAARIPALVDTGGNFPPAMVRSGLRFFLLRSVRRQLEIEIRAQFEAYAATGLPLEHVDAHRHFHLHPTVSALMLRVGSDYGLRAVRLPLEPRLGRRAAPAAEPALPAGTGALLRPWVALLRRRLERAGIRHNDYVLGLSDTGSMSETRVLQLLDHLPDGITELYFHPALASGTEVSADMAGYQHYAEYQALMSERVRARLAASDIRRASYGELAGDVENR